MADLFRARKQLDARARWTQAEAAYVAEHGISTEAVNAFAGLLTITNCQFDGRGHFDFADDGGIPSAVIEVYGEDDATVIDLCVWPITRPCAFATMLEVDALGLARVTNAATWALGDALHIYRTPLRWLQTGCKGLCILDHRYVSVWLREALGPIMAEDLDHARQLYSWLNPPAFPKGRILVPRKTERRAA